MQWRRRAGPINTDRPGFTETAHIIGVGTFQFEFGYTIDREDGSTLHNVGEGVLRYGLNERVGVARGPAVVRLVSGPRQRLGRG